MRRTAITLGLILTLPAVAAAMDVEVAFDSRVDFQRYSSFSWRDGRPSIRPDVQRHIEFSVEQRLSEVGISRGQGTPDVYVSTYVLVDKHTLAALADPSTWDFYTGMTSNDAYQVAAGTLVVDIIDGASNRVVWRGLVAGNISGPVAKNEKKIDKALRKMFSQYPEP